MSIFTGQCVSILKGLSPRTQQKQCDCQNPINRTGAVNKAIKSELKFSIENILGLSSARQTRDPEVSSNTEEYNDDENDDQANDDEDDDGDDEDDEESIDVDDSQVEDNVNTRCFAGDKMQASGGEDSIQYPWLQCTRYHPPKLQRTKKKEGHKKWKLGRNPRIPFTQHQLVVLEDKLRRTHYLSSMDVAELSSALSLTETRLVQLMNCFTCMSSNVNMSSFVLGCLLSRSISITLTPATTPHTWSRNGRSCRVLPAELSFKRCLSVVNRVRPLSSGQIFGVDRCSDQCQQQLMAHPRPIVLL
ncbi:hypothetical protein Btru_047012 [Bulinus truncatus]|nr:hypothetical protein Btru_047012 [Bulinus truncatus]